MDYLKVFLSSLLSLLMLFVSAKVIGNKQMSQLNMFDYINGITIGSIAADMAINLDNNILFPVIAITVYTSVIVLIGYIGSKSVAARRILTGKTITLMDKGKLYYDNFRTAKVDLNEFLTQCRLNGFFNMNDIETALLEQNGMISFMPRSVSRPVNPKDMNITPGPERPFYCIISDGNILNENLSESGITLEKLHSELRCRKLGVTDIYAAFTDGNKFCVFQKIKEAPKNDITQ
ncbi:MAG: DUF421 domain-containing protein [Clostridiales bacterium]|nr:DUF421 domain-containing protein [Clostridiales bacterium]